MQKYLVTYWVKQHAEIELRDEVDPERFVRAAVMPPDAILRSIVKPGRSEDDETTCAACKADADRTIVTFRDVSNETGPLCA